ncbi:hypothetical protein ACHQM5_014695 [Ranunculus cassubicifolius]
MATLTHSKYSWWWDSHIPKNSKWLQENLTDMDSKVKSMIKLIEEDADSFARRAEMYYKKRPELMKLVEEFYRAYRALAERYDQSTGALRQAHKTMAEAFPNQIPFLLPDDSPSSSVTDTEPHTPEMTRPRRASMDPDDLHKDALGLSSSQFNALNRNGGFSDDSDVVMSRRGLKQLHGLFGSGDSEVRVKKGLSFNDDDKVNSPSQSEYQTLKSKVAEESLRASKAETEVQTLTEALAKLETDKEAGLLQYRQSLERLANVETEISRAQEDARGLDEIARRAETELESLREALAKLESEKQAGDHQYRLTLERLSILEIQYSREQEGATELRERACKAETEVQNLKQSLSVLETEKESSLLQYQQCLEKISNLESRISRAEEDAARLNERGSKAEIEAQLLKKALDLLEAEKEACLVQYKQCMETMSNLESNLSHAEENAVRLKERAEKAESDVVSLKAAISTLQEDKEAVDARCQECLSTISNLQSAISSFQEETKRLNHELAEGVLKLQNAEEKYLLLEKENHSLEKELEGMVQKAEMQIRELVEKQEELERLQNHLKEESMHVIQVEAALQALQNLHSQSQDAQRSLTVELEKGFLMLKDMEHWGKSLEDELQRAKDENKSLNDQNLSSNMSISSLQEEIYSLKEMAGKLEGEVGLRLDQRNALQQEIYCLKEEINDLNTRHHGVIQQLESVGLEPDSVGSSVKELQDENSKLMDVYQKETEEKAVLLHKLENLEKILEKNALLEISLADLNAELEAIKQKVKALEDSCQSYQGKTYALIAEKASLVTQLKIATENIEKLSGRNALLENSLFDTNAELECLRAKSKSLQETCKSLDNERSDLLTERDSLVSHLKRFQQKLEDLEKKYAELEEKYSVLEKEKEFTMHQVDELRTSLNLEKQEHAIFSQSSEIRLARLESQVSTLQEEGRWKVKEFEEEQDRTIKSQVEIFILQKCIRDMEEKNFMLLLECEKYFQESKLSEKLISELEQEYHEEQLEVECLLNELQSLRFGIRDILKSVSAHPSYKSEDKIKDRALLQCILKKIEDTESNLLHEQDQKQQAAFENLVLVTLLGQVRLEMTDIASERNILDQELKSRVEELHVLQTEKQNLLDTNGQLRLEAGAAEMQEDLLKNELENLHEKYSKLLEAYSKAMDDNSKLCEGNLLLTKNSSALEKDKHLLEEENSRFLGEAIALANLSLIFKSFSAEKTVELQGLRDDMNHLHQVNNGCKEVISEMEEKLELAETENLHLKESTITLGNELNTTRNANHQLNHQLGIEKEILIQREKELSEASQKLNATETENVELHRTVGELQSQCQEATFAREELERHVLELSIDRSHQREEINILKEANTEFVTKLAKLHEEIREREIREERLSSQLLEKQRNVEHQEEVSAALYGDLQSSTICAAVLTERARELNEAYEGVKRECTCQSADIRQLKERLDALESENGGFKSNFAAYMPIVMSLRDSLSTIEDHVRLRAKVLVADHPSQDAALVSPLPEKSSREPIKSIQNPVITDGVLDLQGLETNIKAVEEAVIEMERLVVEDSFLVNIKLEAAMEEIEKLRSANHSPREEDVQTSKYFVMELEEEEEFGDKLQPKVSLVKNGTIMKDIPLDQMSECSSYDISYSGSHTTSRRENGASDDQMLKLWETSEKGSSGGGERHFRKAEKVAPAPMEEDTSTSHQIEAVEELKSEYPSSELTPEKELGIDKLEISKRFTDSPHQGNRKKILERLASDAQKMTNLQITIEDLKKKMETTNKSKKTSGINYDTLRTQLLEVEESIMKLVDTNVKLSSKVEGSPLRTGEEVEEESRKVRKRRVSEHARRGSEKIGRLQLEVQRIQFALLKLEEEHAVKGANSPDKRSTRIRLRDFLHVSGKNSKGKKKPSCCSCIRPSKGD